MGNGEVEAAASAQAAQPARALDEADQLPDPGGPPMTPDRRVINPVKLEQLEGLRVFARGDLDVVAGGAKSLDDRPQHEDVRGTAHIDPDSQASGLARSRAGRSIPGSPIAGGRGGSAPSLRACARAVRRARSR